MPSVSKHEQFNSAWVDYHDEIYRFCYAALHSQSDAMDCTQSAFLLFWKNIDQVTTPRAWLYRTARHEIGNVLKQKGTLVSLEDDKIRDYAIEISGYTQIYESAAELDESILCRVIGQLSAKEKQLLEYHDQMSTRLIADKLNISEFTVRQRMSRLKRKIAGFIEADCECLR